jgi:predicted dehydrogenase
MMELVDWADMVLHLAAMRVVEKPAQTIGTNSKVTAQVLDLAARRCRVVLLTSTSEVYGKLDKPRSSEEDEGILGPSPGPGGAMPPPRSSTSSRAKAYFKESGFPSGIVRLFNTIGARHTRQYGTVVPRSARKVLAGEPLRDRPRPRRGPIPGHGPSRRASCVMAGPPRGIACIGAGSSGRNLVRALNELGALSWVCESDAGTRAELTERYPELRYTDSVEEVLAARDVRGVVIATPAETHGRLVRQALLAGKDVFVEKPLSLGVREGEKLVELASDRGRILMVGHLLWYHPAVLKLRGLIEAGELGRIRYIYSNRLNLGKIRREENILWSFAPHDISVILGLIGEMPDSVQAQGGNYLHEQIADVTMSLLSFPSGVRAHIFVSWLHPFKEQKLIVVGDRKMAVFDDVEKKDKLLLYPHSIDWKNHLPVPNRADAQPVAFDTTEPLLEECRGYHYRSAQRSPQARYREWLACPESDFLGPGRLLEVGGGIWVSCARRSPKAGLSMRRKFRVRLTY